MAKPKNISSSMRERQTIAGNQYLGSVKIEIMVIEIPYLYYSCVMLCLLGGIRGSSEEAAGVARLESGVRNRVIGHRTAANWKCAIMLSGAADLTEDLK